MLLKVPLFILVISLCYGVDYTSGDAAVTASDRILVPVITSRQSTQNVKLETPVTTQSPHPIMTSEVKKAENSSVETTVTVTASTASISTTPSTLPAHLSPSTSSVPPALSTDLTLASHSTTSSTTHFTTSPTNHSTTSSTTHFTISPTNHSTASPATHSTTSPAPTTPAPEPVPVEKGDWRLASISGPICIRLMAQIKLQVGYAKGNEMGQIDIAVPKSANVGGNCTTGEMDLNWTIDKFLNQTGLASVNFAFSLNNDNKTWKLDHVSVKIDGPGANSTHDAIDFLFNKTGDVNARVGSSYKCLKSNSFSLTPHEASYNKINVTKVDLVLEQLQVEAFKPEKPDNSDFGSANNCEVTPDVVPIVVGCALAALVVIVLVAYLFAQRRPPAQGYRSV